MIIIAKCEPNVKGFLFFLWLGRLKINNFGVLHKVKGRDLCGFLWILVRLFCRGGGEAAGVASLREGGGIFQRKMTEGL